MKKILLTMCFFASVVISAQTFTANKDGDWTDTTLWTITGAIDASTLPTADYDVVLPTGMAVRVKNGVSANMKSLTIGGSGAQLRIDNGSIVKVTGAVHITRSQDGIAMYAQSGPLGSFTYGSVTQNKRIFIRPRLAANNKWALISSPLKESRMNEIAEKNSSNVVTSGTDIGLASYDDSQGANLKYVYYQTANSPHANSAQLTQGKGYSILINNAGDNTKPDHYQRGLLVDAWPINITLSTGGNGFNLLGNPLTGFLNVNSNAHATNNILTANNGILSEATVWFWDSVNSAWITKNQSDAAYKMPGVQGFFVKASSASSFTFTKAMQSDTGDAFLKSSATSNRFEIDLNVTIGKQKRSASIRYIDNMTTDFDNGYDSSTFGGYGSSFEVYTNLVGKDSGKKLAIQSLPNANFEDMIIPVGVTANANSEITFSAKALNVPTGYKVFLEDRLNSTFTRLDEVDAEYTATVTEKTTEGRFYLHARTSALSLDSELLNSVRIYKSNTSTLKIVGLSQGKTNVSLYNVIGEQVLKASFNANGTKEISLPRLSSGVYVVQLETETGKVNKKIVLE